MDGELLVYVKVKRDRFLCENCHFEDNILMFVEKGSFTFSDGAEALTVNPLEAVDFKKEKYYTRKITQPALLHLFRYSSSSDIFASDKIVFKDTARIASTLKLLNEADLKLKSDGFEYKKHLFYDIIAQYRLESKSYIYDILYKDEIIRDAVCFIKQNLHKKISLTALAEKYYLSYVQFARRFKSALGVTPQDYITYIRLNKAKDMLTTTELTVNRIALLCGFQNEYYFGNFFKEKEGISPGAYRKLYSKYS